MSRTRKKPRRARATAAELEKRLTYLTILFLEGIPALLAIPEAMVQFGINQRQAHRYLQMLKGGKNPVARKAVMRADKLLERQKRMAAKSVGEGI